jgi:hypothetical protein
LQVLLASVAVTPSQFGWYSIVHDTPVGEPHVQPQVGAGALIPSCSVVGSAFQGPPHVAPDVLRATSVQPDGGAGVHVHDDASGEGASTPPASTLAVASVPPPSEPPAPESPAPSPTEKPPVTAWHATAKALNESTTRRRTI